MAGSSLSALPANTIRLIGSTQVITSVFSVVKELLENSFDAGAKSIDIKLENYGLDKIEIRDNGSGVKVEEVNLVAQRHYTSKISSHADLERLETYGFRGEALASLCAVSEVSLTTKTANDDVSMTYLLTNQGHVASKKPSHLGQGTTVAAIHLFKNLPVRKQYHNTARKKKEELKKIEDLCISYGVIRPDVRITLRHNKELVWQKNVMADVKCVLLSVLGRNIVNSLERKECQQIDPKVAIEMYLPKPGSDTQVMSRASADRSFLAVNSRPVDVKEIHKLVRQYYCTCHNIETQRHPVYYIAMMIPPDELDVNLDPNKTKVLLHHLDSIKKCIETELLYIYGPLDNQPSWKYSEPSPKRKDNEDENNEVKERVEKYLSQKIEKDDIIDISEIEQNSKRKPEHLLEESNSMKNVTNLDNEWDDSIDDENLMQFEIHTPEQSKSNDGALNNHGDEDVLNSQLTSMKPKDVVVSETSLVNNTNSYVEPVEEADNSNQNLVVSDLSSNNNVDNSESSPRKLLLGSKDGDDFKPLIEDVVKDVVNSDSSKKDVVDSDATKKDVVDSDTTMNCTMDISDLGVGRFDITDDLLDESITGSQPNQSLNKDETQETNTGGNNNGELWSRGRGLASTSGQTVQPVTLLTSNNIATKRPPSPNHNLSLMKQLGPPVKKRALGEKTLQRGQITLYDLVGNKPVKQSSAFDLFVKDQIITVQEEHPDADDEEITAILEDTWNNMADDEKQKYRDERMALISKASKHQEHATNKKLDKKGRSSVRDHLAVAAKNTRRQKRVKEGQKVADVEFNVADLKVKYSESFRESQSQMSRSDKIKLIGPLKSCGSWVCSHGNRILLTNPHRLAETILYHKLLSRHIITTKELEKPVPLSTRNIGEEVLMSTLEKLAKANWSDDPSVVLQDERICANGFDVHCHRDGEGVFHAELVGLAKEIPMFGVADLAETLDVITHTSAHTLKRSRPLKVINFLKSEAVRMMRQSSVERDKEDILELLEQFETEVPAGSTRCLHDKPFSHQVFDLDDVLVSFDDSVAASQMSQS